MKKIVDFVKKKYLVLFIVLTIILLVFVFPKLEHKGTFSLEDDETTLSIDCGSTTALAGDTVLCSLILKPKTGKSYYSVNANYDLSNGGQFSFIVSPTCQGLNDQACFNTSSVNGFTFASNPNLISSNYEIGKLSLTIPSNLQPNSTFDIKLTNIEFCDDQYAMGLISDQKVTIRIKNDDASLSNINVTDATFDTPFSSDKYNYLLTVNSNVSTVNISATKSDVNAVLSGSATVGALDIHYGTNEYQFDVLAEDGTTTKTYNVTFYREYDFNTSRYNYNKAGNYLYTEGDNISTAVSNLETLESGLSYNINGNKLEIKYIDEVLKSIDVINFNLENLSIVNNQIMIGNGLTLAQLNERIDTNGVTYKVFDNSNAQVTDTNSVIGDRYHLKMYYNNSELSDYTFILEYLTFDNTLLVDDATKYIKRLMINKTYAELMALIDTNGTVILQNTSGVINDDNYKIKTGDELVITLPSQTLTYTLSVVGVLDNNVNVTVQDVIKLYRHVKGKALLTGVDLLAGDINNNGSVDLGDVIILYQYLQGKRNTLEVQ